MFADKYANFQQWAPFYRKRVYANYERIIFKFLN